MSNSVRDLYVGINFRDEASKALQLIDQVMDDIEDGAIGLGRGITRTERGFKQFGLSGRNASRMVGTGLNDAETEAGQLNQEVRRINGTLDGFKSKMRGLVGVVAGVFAVDKIKGFGLSAIEDAASAKAMTSQFGQVFEGIDKQATTSLDSVVQKTGMAEGRLKGSFIQMAAFAKTTGMKTEGALALSERATLAAADSAAFYDRSIEDVTENLQSFLKGNYENDAALGISATEFTRNTAAMKLYGKQFTKLSEEQKQLTLLQMVEDGNKLSGALGQAALEADAYENVMGNLKQTWTDFKIKIGGPLLQPFVNGMQMATKWIQGFDTDKIVDGFENIKSFAGTVKDTIMSLVNDTGDVSGLWQKFGLPKETSDNIASFADTMRSAVVVGIDAASVAFDGFKTGVSWVIENKEIVIAAAAGIAGGFAVFKTISTVTTVLNLFKNSMTLSTFATQGFNAALRANPIGMVVTAIGLLVTAGVYLYQNWDTVKAAAGELWGKVTEVFGGIYDWGVQKIQPVTSFFKGLYDKFIDFKNAILSFKPPEWVSKIGGAISGAASKIGGWISGSHATGLERVPFDGYVAELHKDEAVLTANQSNMLRRAGILSQGSLGTPELNLDNNNKSESLPTLNNDKQDSTPANNGGHQFIFQITGDNPVDIAQKVREVISDIIDSEMQTT